MSYLRKLRRQRLPKQRPTHSPLCAHGRAYLQRCADEDGLSLSDYMALHHLDGQSRFTIH